jgi:putative transposase
MTVDSKKAVPKDLIDSLLADYKKPEDLIGENGLLKQLTKLLVERALGKLCKTRGLPHKCETVSV